MPKSTRIPQPLLVRGSVRLPADAAPFARGQARVQLLDVTEVGAASTVVVEQIISNVSPGEPVDFELRGEVPPSNRSYSVSVHIKPNPDPTSDKYDAVEVGDYITVQSYPVTLSAEKPAEVNAEVRRV